MIQPRASALKHKVVGLAELRKAVWLNPLRRGRAAVKAQAPDLGARNPSTKQVVTSRRVGVVWSALSANAPAMNRKHKKKIKVNWAVRQKRKITAERIMKIDVV